MSSYLDVIGMAILQKVHLCLNVVDGVCNVVSRQSTVHDNDGRTNNPVIPIQQVPAFFLPPDINTCIDMCPRCYALQEALHALDLGCSDIGQGGGRVSVQRGQSDVVKVHQADFGYTSLTYLAQRWRPKYALLTIERALLQPNYPPLPHQQRLRSLRESSASPPLRRTRNCVLIVP